MKKKHFIIVVVVLSLLSLTLPATTWAAEVLKIKSKGRGVDAVFVTTEGCINTVVGIFGREQRVRDSSNSKEWSAGVDIYLSQEDSCNGTILLAAVADEPLTGAELQINKNLQSARLNTTVSVFDWVSGQSFDVAIDLTWTGNGNVSHEEFKSHETLPGGCKLRYHFNGASAEAEASGQVSIGTTNLTPNPVSGSLTSTHTGQMQIGCEGVEIPGG